MKLNEWLIIDSKHPYVKESKMDFLGIFPTLQTQQWLSNHRHNWKSNSGSTTLSVGISSNNEVEIPPVNGPVVLEFHLGVNDLSFTNFTDFDSTPLHYAQHFYEVKINNKITESRILDFKNSIKVEGPSAISLPNSYFPLGKLKIEFENLNELLNQLSSSPIHIKIESQEKSYTLIYGIQNDPENDKMPNFLEDESQNVDFYTLNVDNSKWLFLATKTEVPISCLNLLECVPYHIDSTMNKRKLKCRIPKFNLSFISKSPSFPHNPVLLREIKY